MTTLHADGDALVEVCRYAVQNNHSLYISAHDVMNDIRRLAAECVARLKSSGKWGSGDGVETYWTGSVYVRVDGDGELSVFLSPTPPSVLGAVLINVEDGA